MNHNLLRFPLLILMVTSLLVLCGCGTQDSVTAQELQPLVNAPWMAGESPVPDRRTGLYRQNSDGPSNAVEYTASGIYYLTHGDDYLLYCDHDSDTFIPLCSRPDCSHADYEGKDYWTCDAYWPGAFGICFYEGYLYVLENGADGFGIRRVKPDGTDREWVCSLGADFSAYSMWSGMTIWNGIVTFTVHSLDDNGDQIQEDFYYKLDGSMDKPMPAPVSVPRGNHGDLFIDSKDDFYVWDGSSAQSSFLTEYLGNGYYTDEEAYVVLDGVISKVTYATGEVEALLDTGLEGTYDLLCYPDCLVVLETLPYIELATGGKLEKQHMYFYNWEFAPLGSIEVEYSDTVWTSTTVFFETATRIYLSLEYDGDPSHYIEKSDFGTGDIVLHEVNLPTLPVLETGSSPPH